MATSPPNIHPMETPQDFIPKCEKHDLAVDKICKNCEMFICSICTNLDHLDHNWDTITKAARLRRSELKNCLVKIMEDDVQQIDEKIKAAAKQMEDNQAFYDKEVLKLQNHYDAIVKEVNEIKEINENLLRCTLNERKSELCTKQSGLENKKSDVMDLVTILDEKHRNMSDYVLIHNLRALENLISNTENDEQKHDFSLRYIRGDFNKKILDMLMGKTCADIAELELDILTMDISTTDPLQNMYCVSMGWEHLCKALNCTIL